ncbi:MAG: T9SS type A sorting domain-containing protein [Bacteroidetes bacterium]|nr:T9SS type A sorting domain-containing protein [Bacteroidota bacterium]
MLKRIIYVIITLASLLFSYFLFQQKKQDKTNSKSLVLNQRSEENETGYPREAAEWYYEQRAFPLGHIPADWIEKAFTHITKFNKPDYLKKSLTSLAWNELGPGNIGGRVRAIVVDPNDSSIVYAGSVSGGIWKTTNAGINWFPLDDHMLNLTVCSIVMDPNNSNIIYAGTGEGFNNYDYLRGNGIFKTTDAGKTWNQLSSTNTPDFYFVNRLAFDRTTNSIYAATRTGLFKSTDGGNSFSQVINSSSANGGTCLDVIINYTNPTTIFASFGLFIQSQIWRSTDGGNNFQFDYSYTKTPTGRIELAGSQSDPKVAYASFMDANSYGIAVMAVTTDAGNTWNTFQPPGPSTDKNSTYAGKQGWYDNALAVDPDNSSIVYAAGIDMWKSTNKGNSWVRITNAYNFNDPASYVHPDFHTIVFAPSNHDIMYTGNDGGVYFSKSRGSYWNPINNNLSITQFYSCAVASSGTAYYGGTQDNYTLKSTGSKSWFQVIGGDGGDVEVDYNNSNNVYAELPDFEFVKSTDACQNFSYAQNGIPINSDHTATDRTLFITPFTMDPNNPQIIAAGTYRVWRTTDGALSWNAISGDLTGDGAGSTGAKISAVTAANGNSNVIYAGCSNGKVWVTTDAGITWNERDQGIDSAWCTKITTGLSDPSIAYVTFSGFLPNHKVYKTTDYGQTWNNISGDLPNIPVNCLIINPYANDNLFIGTDLGVFSTINGGLNWIQDNNGFANVATLDLDYRPFDNTMFAATHGRGLFSTNLPIGSGQVLLSYDSGTPAGGYAWTVAGMASANKITPPVKGVKIIKMSIYFTGVQSGNAVYLPIILKSANGQPGNDYITLPSKTISTIPGWDETDLSSYNLIANDEFFVGIKFDGVNQPMFGYSKSGNGRAWNFNGSNWASWGQTYFMRAVVQNVTSSIEISTQIPKTFKLYQNYPNPFNPSTTIKYELPKPDEVKLIIYDISGKKVTTLANNFQSAGTYSVTWNGKNDFGKDVSSGVYFYSFETSNFSQVNKMLKLK